MASKNFYYYRGNRINLTSVDNTKFVTPSRGENSYNVAARLAKSGRLVVEPDAPRGYLIVRGTPEKINALKNYKDIQTTRSAYLTDDNRELILTNEILVKFSETVSQDAAKMILKSVGCTAVRQVDDVWVAQVLDLDDEAPLTVANNLASMKNITFAEPNAIQAARPELIMPPADARFVNQWHLNNTGQGGGTLEADVHALNAWEITYGNPDIKIVVHDSGVDISHPDLQPNIIDGWDFDNNDNNPENNNNAHGTACAGIVASPINGTGVVGIAPDCRIVPLRMAGSHTWNEWAESISWASKHGDIVTCSWTISPNETLSNAIKKASKEGRSGLGTTFFFASGNGSSSSIGFPAKVPEVIAVGASTNQDLRSSYSNYGAGLHVVAPSSGGTLRIETTDIQGNHGYNSQIGEIGDYCNASAANGFGGTSAATPLTAGVGALMLAANPALTSSKIKDILAETADQIDLNNHPYSSPVVGTQIARYDWSNDWTTAEFFSVDSKSYLFLLKKNNGIVHIHKMDADGSVGSQVKDYDWASGWTTAEFFTFGSNTFLFLLKQDSGIVHIHKMNPDGTVGSRVIEYDWSKGWTSVKFFTVGTDTYLFLLKQENGIVHIHKMNSNGTVGTKVIDYDWSNGWTTAEFFTIGATTYLFLLKQSNGIVHIHKMNNTGTVGTMIEAHDWSSGWTTAQFFTSGTNTYLFLLKQSNGIVHIHKMNAIGTVGTMIKDYDWSSGWSTVEFFNFGSIVFLFLLKKSNGIVHIHEIENILWNEEYGFGRVNAQRAVKEAFGTRPKGAIGHKIAGYDWSSKWTTANFYTIGNNTYLFLLKQSNGIVHIHKMNNDGTVGSRVIDYDWTSGWTTAEFFTVGTSTFLFLLKQSNGIVHIHKMNNDGTVGTSVINYDWSDNWTTANFYTIGTNTYLFLLKQSDGIVHIHKMNSNGTVGTRVIDFDWSNGWTTAEFFTVGTITYLFLLKESNGIVHIHKMNADGSVGSRIINYDWSGGWTTAEFFTIGTNTYLFLLKQSNGIVHIHKMNADGSVGSRVIDYDWSGGWTTAELFTVNTKTYLFLLKETNGNVHLHEVMT